MRHLMIFTFVFSLLLPTAVFGEEVIRSYKVSSLNPKISQISDDFEIKMRTSDGYLVYVIENRVSEFLKLAPSAELVERDINHSLKMESFSSGGSKGDDTKSRYHSYDEVVSLYKDFSIQYSSKAKLIEYGKSAKGNTLFALKVSDNVELDEDEPKILITSATHGDELITVEVQLALVGELLGQSINDSRLQKMIDQYQIYFIPVVNPDGFSKRSRYAGGVDPNRQYPWPNNPNKVTKVACIKHLIEFYHFHDFKGSMDIHASGQMIMFPWAFTRKIINQSDYDHMDALTTELAQRNGYKHGPISKVIYTAKGSSADYFYWKNGGVALAAELSTSKYPSASRISKVVDESREMIWKFIESF